MIGRVQCRNWTQKQLWSQKQVWNIWETQRYGLIFSIGWWVAAWGHSYFRSSPWCLSMFLAYVLVGPLPLIVFPVIARGHSQGKENACMKEKPLLPVWLVPCGHNMLQPCNWRDKPKPISEQKDQKVCSCLFMFVLSLSAGSIKIIPEWKVSRQSQSIAYLG